VSVERGGKKADLLVYRADGAVGKETAVSWLKRRFIGGGNVLVPDDGRVLDRVPDIMWIVSANEPWAQNYKGVTIVSFGKPRSALISLRDRKIEIR
jgi:hypothetical protein